MPRQQQLPFQATAQRTALQTKKPRQQRVTRLNEGPQEHKSPSEQPQGLTATRKTSQRALGCDSQRREAMLGDMQRSDVCQLS